MDVVGALPGLRAYARVFTSDQGVADDHVADALKRVIARTEGGRPPSDVLACLLKHIRQSVFAESIQHQRLAQQTANRLPDSAREIRTPQLVQDEFYQLPLAEREVVVLLDLLKLDAALASEVVQLSPQAIVSLHERAHKHQRHSKP